MKRFMAVLTALVGVAFSMLASPAAAVVVHNPILAVDSAAPSYNTVSISGWAADLDSPGSSVTLQLTDNGRFVLGTSANMPRPDVNRVMGIPGNHGYRFLSVPAATGIHTFCITAYNLGPGVSTTACRLVSVLADVAPFGRLDAVTMNNDGTAVASGWTLDRNVPTVGTQVSFTETTALGALAPLQTVGILRPDVNSAFNVSGIHGFKVVLDTRRLGDGFRRICATAINAGPAGSRLNASIGCQNFTVANLPQGSLTAQGVPGGIQMDGWAYDPNDPSVSLSLRLNLVTPSDPSWVIPMANLPSPDIDAIAHITGNHRFSFLVPTGSGQITFELVADNIGAGWATPNSYLGYGVVNVP